MSWGILSKWEYFPKYDSKSQGENTRRRIVHYSFARVLRSENSAKAFHPTNTFASILKMATSFNIEEE
jgi:hypothetical protein